VNEFSIIIIPFAFFIQAVMGFGGGLIATPLLALFNPVSESVTFILFFQFSMGLLLFKIYKDIDWKVLVPFIPGMFFGTLAGLYSLAYMNADYIRIILSLFIIFYIINNRLNPTFITKLIERLGTHVVSFAAGWLSGLVGMGAPLYVIYFKERIKEPKQFRASIVAVLFFANVVRLPVSFAAGFVSFEMIQLIILGFPLFLFSLWVGHKVYNHIPEKIFSNLVMTLLLGSVLSLMTKVIL